MNITLKRTDLNQYGKTISNPHELKLNHFKVSTQITFIADTIDFLDDDGKTYILKNRNGPITINCPINLKNKYNRIDEEWEVSRWIETKQLKPMNG